MTVQYTANSATEYQVWQDFSHMLGYVQKRGMRWLAITPANRILGSFDSMSKAGAYLVREDEKK